MTWRLGVLLVAGCCWAQETEAPGFRVETRLVQTEVRVSDKKGNPIEGLTAADFLLKEDGERQEINSVEFVGSLEPPLSSSPPRPQSAAAAREAAGDRDPVWIYIATETAPRDFLRVGAAIERFLADDFRQGLRVSLGGLPFTSNRARLLETLSVMRRGPFGRKGTTGLADPTLVHLEDLELLREQMQINERQAKQGRPWRDPSYFRCRSPWR